MSNEFWVAGNDEHAILQNLLGQYHPEVATANFSIIFKSTATTSEIESGIVAQAKKVPPLYKVLTEDLDFIIIVAKPLWDELSPNEQEAHLDSALCSCTAKIDEDGDFKVDKAGNPIFVMKSFDLMGHSEVLARYGVDMFAEVGSRIKSAINKAQKELDADAA